jgi:hypothetical protein
MEHDIYAIGGVAGLALGGLGISNLLHDRGAAGTLGRRVASALGGAAYLVAVLLLNVTTAMAVLGGLTLLVIVLRLGPSRWMRGTQGTRSSQAWSQVTFAVSGTASLAIGWGLLGDRWLGFLPVAFLAWGDNAAGLFSDWIPRLWPSAAMLAVSLAAALVLRPYWIGVIGAVAATVGERYRPPFRFWDDNLNLVAASLAVMVLLTRIVP